MSHVSRAIVPVEQHGIVAAVVRQIKVVEKILAKNTAQRKTLATNSVKPELVIQFASGISAAAISSDGKYILTISEVENSIYLWDVATSSILRVFGHNAAGSSGIKYLKFQSDGTSAVTEYFDGSIGIWDLPTGICHWQPSLPSFATTWRDDKTAVAPLDNTLVYSPDGHYSLCKILIDAEQHDDLGDTQNNQYLWDGDYFVEGRQIRIGSEDDYPIALSDGGRYTLLRNSNIETVSVWDLEQESSVSNICPVWMPHYDHVACSDDSSHLVLAGAGNLQYWDITKGHLVSHVSTDGDIHAIAFSPENHLAIAQRVYQPSLFSGREMNPLSSWPDFKGNIPFQLLDIHSGKCLQTFEGHTGKINTITIFFSNDGKRIAAAQSKVFCACILNAWNVVTGALSITKKIKFIDHADHFLSLASIGGLWGSKNICKVLIKETRQIRDVIHPGRVTAAIFSPDGKNFVTGCIDANVRIYNMDCNLRKVLQGHEETVTMVRFSPQGDQIVSASADQTIRLWDVSTGQCQHILRGHSSGILHASFINNGLQILSVGHDRTIRFWCAKTGKALAQCYGFDDGNWVVVAPDGRYDSSSNGDCPYLRWTVGMDSFPVSKFKEQYYTAGLLKFVMDGCQGRKPSDNLRSSIETLEKRFKDFPETIQKQIIMELRPILQKRKQEQQKPSPK